MLVGTRNWNTKSALPPDLQKLDHDSLTQGDTLIPVTVFERRIRYRWYFAIPALLALALVVLITLAACLLMILRRGMPSRIDHYLKHLSSGRLLGAVQYPAEDKETPTKVWIKQVGRRQSDLHRHGAAYGAPSVSTPFFAQPTPYPDKSSELVNHFSITGGSPPKGGYAKINTYDRPADEIFGQAR